MAGGQRRSRPARRAASARARSATWEAAVQPGRQRPTPPHRAGLAGQYQEGGLEGVVGRVGVAEDAAADAEDHRAVPSDQGGEGEGVAAGGEPPEQFGVGRVGAGGQPEESAGRWGRSSVGHRPALGASRLPPE
jgi:hypothetical protein